MSRDAGSRAGPGPVSREARAAGLALLYNSSLAAPVVISSRL